MPRKIKHGNCESRHNIVLHGEPGGWDLDGDKGLRLQKEVTTLIPIYSYHFGKCNNNEKRRKQKKVDGLKGLLWAVKKIGCNPANYKICIRWIRSHWGLSDEPCGKPVLEIMLGHKEWVCFNCRMINCEGLEPMPDGKGSWIYVPCDTVYDSGDEEITGVVWSKKRRKEESKNA